MAIRQAISNALDIDAPSMTTSPLARLLATGQWGGGGSIDPLNQQQLLKDIANPPEKWIPRTATRPTYEQWLASKGPNYVDPATGIVRGTTDNSAAYEYANEFFQLPTNRGDWLTMSPVWGGAALVGGAALSGLGAGGAGAAEAGAAGLAGAEVAAPVGTALATAAEEAAIADLVATGMSTEAATAAVMSGGGTLAGVSSGFGGSTALGRLLGLGQTGQDLLSVGGAVAPAVLGYFGADKTSDAYRDVANQYLNIGAPYRSTLEASYKPGFDLISQPGYGDALNRSAEIAARAASAKYGNPGENPGAIADITNQVWNQGYLPALANYRGQLGQFGGLGLNTSGAASLGGAEVAGGAIDAIGVGAGRAMTPSLSDLYRQYLTVNGARV